MPDKVLERPRRETIPEDPESVGALKKVAAYSRLSRRVLVLLEERRLTEQTARRAAA